jgi:hypothetical protein
MIRFKRQSFATALLTVAVMGSFALASGHVQAANSAMPDGFQHVMVLSNDGAVHEIYFKGAQGVQQDVLATIPGAIAVAGYYAGSST